MLKLEEFIPVESAWFNDVENKMPKDWWYLIYLDATYYVRFIE